LNTRLILYLQQWSVITLRWL